MLLEDFLVTFEGSTSNGKVELSVSEALGHSKIVYVSSELLSMLLSFDEGSYHFGTENFTGTFFDHDRLKNLNHMNYLVFIDDHH
jgi:hypothetical protein